MQAIETETIELNGLTAKVSIYLDETPENPRKAWDNLGTMLCAHRRYNLGDEDGLDGDDVRERVKEALKAGAVVLPLFLYDHGGITMSTGSFSCPWDSGQVGYIYMTAEKGRANWGRIWKKKALACLQAEVKTYDQYLTGEVYGYVAQLLDENGEELENEQDSCWGFYGMETAKEEAKEAVKGMLEREAREAEACAACVAL